MKETSQKITLKRGFLRRGDCSQIQLFTAFVFRKNYGLLSGGKWKWNIQKEQKKKGWLGVLQKTECLTNTHTQYTIVNKWGGNDKVYTLKWNGINYWLRSSLSSKSNMDCNLKLYMLLTDTINAIEIERFFKLGWFLLNKSRNSIFFRRVMEMVKSYTELNYSYF